jgi:hypothetical protein
MLQFHSDALIEMLIDDLLEELVVVLNNIEI